MLPYLNMINRDPGTALRQANEAQAAAIYQGSRRMGRLVRSMAHALRHLWAVPVRAFHSVPRKPAQPSRG